MTKKLFWLLLFCALSLGSAAAADPINVTDDPLVIGGGARPLGMGRAFAAIADDADAIFINPGGLASLKAPQAMAMFTNLLGGEVYYSEYCGAIPADFGAVGIGYISTGVNRIPSFIDPTTEVFTDYYDSVLAFNYSSALARFFQYAENVYVGCNLKIYNRGFSGYYNQAASGFSGDFGIKYIMSPYLNFALARQNFIPVSLGAGIGTSGAVEEALAGVTKIATAFKPKQLAGRLLIAADLDIPSQGGQPATGHLGSEWKISPMVSLRAGFDQSIDAATASGTSWSPTLGTSFNYAGFRMDFAFHPYYNDPTLATSYFSFSYAGASWFAMKGKVE
ncbi:MAG TPA: hypothetical protein VMT55_02510 [Candidatus Sulfotelmatobacter sp.]|nr:hypothetical protein [Candidatus Sulfotelmatobacter sp.]